MSARTPAIHLVPHFHYDPIWIEDQRTYTRQAFDLILQYLEACRQDPTYHLILSELDYLQPFLAAHGEYRQFIRELAGSGRLYAGGSYNEPDEMLLQGEPLLRNFLYGRLYHERALGLNPSVYIPFDVFGHCLQLPQLAEKAGFRAMVWSKDITGVLPVCLALAPDGTKLLQKHEPYTYHPETWEQFQATVREGYENQTALGLTQDLRIIGMDMAAPRAWLTGKSGELAQHDPPVIFSTPEKYLAAVTPEIPQALLPLSGRDLSFDHGGTLVTRADLKMANRLAENKTLSAEKWATFAALLGAIYPEAALDKAWRQLLFGQHHDGLTGCCADVPYLDLLACYREALELADEVEAKSLSYAAGRINTTGHRLPEGAQALVVFNSMSWNRTEAGRTRVTLTGALAQGFKLLGPNGREVACQLMARGGEGSSSWVELAFLAKDLPSLGYDTYHLVPASKLPPVAEFAEAPDPAIENEKLSLRADSARGGTLSSIFLKQQQKELLREGEGGANELYFLTEKPDREMAPWELFTTGEQVRTGSFPARVEVAQGPVFSTIRATVPLPGRGELVQETTLYQGLGQVFVRTTLRNYEGVHELLALSYPLALPGASAIFEDRFATVLRRRSLGNYDFRTNWEQNISNCGLGAAVNWVEAGPAPSLYITSGNRTMGAHPLGPCAIITSGELQDRAAAETLMKALLARGVTCSHRLDIEDPEGDPAACAFRICLGRANAYAATLLADAAEAASLLEQAVAKGPWGGVVMKRPDPSGVWPEVPVLIADTAGEGGSTKLAELLAEEIRADKLALPEAQDCSGLAQPSEDCGLALINRGTVAASLEQDGTLLSLLTHTSSWDARPWGEGLLDRYFIPEHRTHIFEHAFVPHAGDWRKAQLVRRGLEVNNPLRAVQVPVQEGVLPARGSFLSIEEENVIVAAVKPFGAPFAAKLAEEHSHPANGLLVRLYEAHGEATTTALKFSSTPETAWATDLLERKTGEVEITKPRWGRKAEVKVALGPCEVSSIAVMLAPIAEAGRPQELGPTAEPYRPVPTRYWDHNSGAAPLGNMPVTLWTRGPLPLGQNTRFPLGVNNETMDREITGAVQMIAPPEWTMIPRQLPYRIPPNTAALYEVMVIVPPDAKPCYLRAVTKQGEFEVQDVIPVGEVAPLEATLTRRDGAFVVSVRNPNADYIEGEVTLITPLESWGDLVDGLAVSSITPRAQAFRIEAEENRDFLFSIAGDAPAWAIARLAWYGNVRYLQEELFGLRRASAALSVSS